MAWITSIDLKNYRAFTSLEQPIKIPKGHHVLIYGENGSGKTSIFHALDHILRTSFSNARSQFHRNVFTDSAEPAMIQIEVSDIVGANRVQVFQVADDPDASNNSIPLLQRASKVRGFLDYKKILVAHALGLDDGGRLNVFDLLVRFLLSDHTIAIGSSSTTVGLLDEYRRISGILLSKRAGSHDHNRALVNLADWNSALIQLLTDTANIANGFLQGHFRNKLHLDFYITPANVYKPEGWSKKKMKEEIYFKISYADTEIQDYHLFLNEARLSAFSICLFLASIKTYPIHSSELRII